MSESPPRPARRTCPVFYLEIPPFLFGPVIKGLTEAGLTKTGAGRRREAVRPRPRVGEGARAGDPPVHRRVPALPDRSLPREDGSRRVPIPPLRELELRADLEPQSHRGGRDHDGGELRGRGPRPLLRSVGALRDVVVNHLMQLLAAAAMEAPAGDDADTLRTPSSRCSARCPPRTPALRSRPIRRLPRYRWRCEGIDHRDVRGDAARDRQLALGRRAVVHPHREATPGHPDRSAACVPPPPRLGFLPRPGTGRRSRASS